MDRGFNMQADIFNQQNLAALYVASVSLIAVFSLWCFVAVVFRRFF